MSHQLQYVAPAQTLIFIGDVWIDDACAIQVSVQDEKFPIWGYNDILFRANARGRTVVQGKLSIKFRSIGYLKRAIDALQPLEGIAEEFNKNARIRQFGVQSIAELRTLAIKDPRKIVRLVAEASSLGGDNRDIEERADLLRRIVGHPANTGGSILRKVSALSERARQSPPREEFLRASLQMQRGVNLLLLYGNQEELDNPERVEIITDVQFVGESKVISAEVPMGGEAIVEEYPFYARDKRPLISRDPDTPE